MRILFLFVKTSKKLFLTASVTSAATGVFLTFMIKSIHELLQDDNFDDNFEPWRFILNFGIYLVAYGIFSLLSSYSMTKLGQKIIHNLRIQLSDSFLKASFETMEQNQKKILPVLTSDIATIAHSVNRLPQVSTGIALIIGISAYMIWYNPFLSITTVLLFLFIFLCIFLFTKIASPYIKKYSEQARIQISELYHHFHGLVYGIKELVLNKQSKKRFLSDFIIPTSKLENKSYLKENMIGAVVSGATNMIILLGIAGLIIAIYNIDSIAIEDFSKHLTLVLFTLAPLSIATSFINSLKRLEVSLEHIKDAGLNLIEDSYNEGLATLDEGHDKENIISLKKIEHSYYHRDEEEHFTLGPIDLDIKRNEILFIVGGNGSGKTTLAKLLLSLYHPLKGDVLYEGQKITENNLSTFRSKFSAVFVDSYLFENFLNIDKEYLKEYGEKLLKLFQLTKKVKIKDHRFTTKNLSDGQKRRLALIISILENKEIYMLDEWAANQDPQFKEILYVEILPLLKKMGKTLIVITHDDKYFQNSDRVIKIIDGHISNF